MRFFIKDLGYIGGQFIKNGVQYPSNWLSLASDEELASLEAYKQPSYDPLIEKLVEDPNTGWVVIPLSDEEKLQKATEEQQRQLNLINQAKQEVINTIQRRLDDFAKTWGYDDIRSACTYIGDPYPRFNAEAIALRNWRSATWVVADQNQNITNKEDFMALLPDFPTRPNI